MKYITGCFVILAVCCFYLFISGQQPFPDLEAKLRAGEDVIASISFKTDTDRIYFFATEEYLIDMSYEKELFWAGGMALTRRRTGYITGGSGGRRFRIGEEDYTFVYGIVNDETVSSIEIHMANGEILPVIPNQDGFFLVQLLWNSAVELCAYDREGNLLYQMDIIGDIFF